MYPFFRIIEDLGINQSRMAERLGMSAMSYWRVRTGATQPSHAFMGKAVQALKEMGIQRSRMTYYTVDDLFYADVEKSA